MIITLAPPGINNASLQVGDTAYYSTTSSLDSQMMGGTPVELGTILAIGNNWIEVQSQEGIPNNAFIMFLKDSRANNTSLKGYYAEVKMSHLGGEKAELFALGSEVTESSK